MCTGTQKSHGAKSETDQFPLQTHTRTHTVPWLSSENVSADSNEAQVCLLSRRAIQSPGEWVGQEFSFFMYKYCSELNNGHAKISGPKSWKL